MAIILKADGSRAHLPAPQVMDGKQTEFNAELEKIVGGFIELVWVLYVLSPVISTVAPASGVVPSSS